MKKCLRVLLCVMMAFGLFAMSADAVLSDYKIQLRIIRLLPNDEGKLTLEVTAENCTNRPLSGKLLFATYDESDRMTGIYSTDFSLAGEDWEPLPTLVLPFNDLPTGTYYKLFLWDILGGLEPLSRRETNLIIRPVANRAMVVRSTGYRGKDDELKSHIIYGKQASNDVQADIALEDFTDYSFHFGDVIVFDDIDEEGFVIGLNLLFMAEDAREKKNFDNELWQRAYDIFSDGNPDNDGEITGVFGFVARKYDGSFYLTENYVSSFSEDTPHLVLPVSSPDVNFYEVDLTSRRQEVIASSYGATLVTLNEGNLGSYAYIIFRDGVVTDVVVYRMENGYDYF